MGKPDYLQIKEVQAYKTYLEVEKNYTEATINDYLEDLKNYFAYLNEEGLKFTEIEYNDARNYIAYLGFKKKNSPSTVARSISTLRSFYRFLMKEEKVTTNVFTLLKMPKKANHLPRFFYYNELEELFQVPDLTIPLGQRDALILEILYGTGIRVSELVAIKIPDIDLTRREIRIMGKGQKMRIVYFEPIVQKRLKLYLHDGREKLLSNNKHEYLLVNHLGNPLTTRGVRDILTRMIEKTALQKKISRLGFFLFAGQNFFTNRMAYPILFGGTVSFASNGTYDAKFFLEAKKGWQERSVCNRRKMDIRR